MVTFKDCLADYGDVVVGFLKDKKQKKVDVFFKTNRKNISLDSEFAQIKALEDLICEIDCIIDELKNPDKQEEKEND